MFDHVDFIAEVQKLHEIIHIRTSGYETGLEAKNSRPLFGTRCRLQLTGFDCFQNPLVRDHQNKTLYTVHNGNDKESRGTRSTASPQSK